MAASVFGDCSSFQFALLGIVSAILFIVIAARIFLGEPLLPTAIPLPELLLSVLVVTFIGWIWALWRES